MTEIPNSEIRDPQSGHTTVLLRETVDLVAPRPGGVYVDGTLGGGGHAEEVLKRSAPDGVLVGLDQDAAALGRSRQRLAGYGARAIIRQANFRDLPSVLAELKIGSVDGIVLDLGLSWFHLRDAGRGFSFMADGPLDMRMDAENPTTAADLVNTLPRQELTRILFEYGEEKKAKAIAKAIEKARDRGPLTSTVQLAQIVSSVFPPYPPRRIHPATLTFQALRIAVNDELAALRDGLDHAVRLLRPGGRIAIISFHSLEDRIVKQAFVAHAKGCICPPRLPVCSCGKTPVLKILTKRPVMASEDEVAQNAAARSAKLRAAEKLP
ncbi:MAG: 16S rRNA (cytosine(1402)-N(4))-methyltransferase RsmH [Nitrospirota bacterium]